MVQLLELELGYLQDLGNIGSIVLYAANSEDYLYIPDFVPKQPSLNPNREAKPTIPIPTPDQLQSKSGLTLLKVKESKVKEKQSKEKYMSTFDVARKKYPSTKKGLQTEFNNFAKKHTDWKDILPLLLPAIEQQIIWRQQDGRYWKHFQTWINQRCWEDSASNQVQERKNGSQVGHGSKKRDETYIR